MTITEVAGFSTSGVFDLTPNITCSWRLSIKGRMFAYNANARKTMAQIVDEVLAAHYPDITDTQVYSLSRTRPVARCRQHIWWEIQRQRPDLSHGAIALRFKRHRTSVTHGIDEYARRLMEEGSK